MSEQAGLMILVAGAAPAGGGEGSPPLAPDVLRGGGRGLPPFLGGPPPAGAAPPPHGAVAGASGAGVVRPLLQGHDGPAAVPPARGHEPLGRGVVEGVAQRLGRDPAEHDGVRGADAASSATWCPAARSEAAR